MRGWLLLPIVLAACDTAANDTAAKNRAASHSAVVKSSAATPSADPCSKAQVAGAIAWIHDDFATALACARAKKLPLVIDWWAPWCHTC
jgi:thioredoxin-like negative regulator of GroEL